MWNRRTICRLAGALVLWPSASGISARAEAASAALATAPIELGGEWDGSLPSSALRVVERMRAACLAGVALLSDRQPDAIRVDDHSSGPPHIWLHSDHPTTAWIVVDIGSRDWCKLAYQFGHELGHVLCNSWSPNAKPRPPSQWLEESMVEAFSIRGLGLLAGSWERDPPFAGDNAFGGAIRKYRQDVIDRYAKAVDRSSYADLDDWFRQDHGMVERPGIGLNPVEGPVILAVLGEFERDESCVADLGALNRWPERTGVPLERYLSLWEASCRELGAPGRLPGRLRNLFRARATDGM